jgi:glycosyltransferase involved in cell wall biosynthesis
VLTYHCDLTLPDGLVNRGVNLVVHVMNHLAARLADRVVTYTRDYATASPFLSRWADRLEVVSPPVELPAADPDAIRTLGARLNPQGRRPVIGMAARLAAEKGVEVLLQALPRVLATHPEALVLFAGQHLDVLGEHAYFNRLQPIISELQREGRWHFAGVLPPEEMAAFYPNLEVLVVPSLNATESFGLVQIEAMMSGVPVVASNLPGVRQPVRMTGMGLIAEVGDHDSLADALLRILARPDDFAANPAEIATRFSPDATASTYERLFERLLEGDVSPT